MHAAWESEGLAACPDWGGRRLSMAMCVTHLGMTYFVCIHLSFYPCAGMSICLVSFVARKPRTTCHLGR